MQQILEPRKSYFKVDLKEIYRYRELLWMLTWRDIRVQYAQTYVGLIWALLNPLLTLLVLSFVFSVIAKVDMQGTPPLVFTIAGMCGWTYFSTVVSQSGTSLVQAQNMVKKIYFPRLIIPLSKGLLAMMDLAIVLFCLFVLMCYYRQLPSSNVLFLPLFVGLAMGIGLGMGIWISALTIRFRDFFHITPLLLRIGLYATPVAYPLDAVPPGWRWLVAMNPLTGIIVGIRWSLLGTGALPWSAILISISSVTVLLLSGIFYINKLEPLMAYLL